MTKPAATRSRRAPAPRKSQEPAPLGFGDESEQPIDAAGKKLSPIEQDEVRQQEKILELLDRHRESGGYIEVFSKPPGEMAFGFLATIPVEAYSLQKLADKFGGGDYKLVAKTGEHKYITTWFPIVDHNVQIKRPQAGPAPAGGTNDTATIIKQVTDVLSPLLVRSPADTALKDFMPAIVAAVGRPQSDNSEFFKLMLEQNRRSEERFEKLLEKMATAQARGGSLRDTLEDLAALDEFRGGGDEPKEKKGSFFEELARTLAPAIAPLLGQLVANNGGGFPGQGQPQPQLRAPAATVRPTQNGAGAAPRPENPPSTETEDPMNLQLKFMLGQFKSAALSAARKSEDAATFALNTLRMVPDEFHPKIFSAANADDWFASLFSSDPEATKFLPFMTQVRDTILAQSVVFVARANFKMRASPTDTARVIIESLSQSFHPYLFDETERGNWSALFDGEEIAPAWLEELRVAIDNALGGDDSAAAAPAAAPAPAAAAAKN